MLTGTSAYSQSQQKSENDNNTVSRYYTAQNTSVTTPEPARSTPATMDSKNSVQYPVTKIYDGDTVVIMTLQQGKDMNRKFVILRDSVKAQRKRLDTLLQTNDFLVDYVTAIQYKNSDLKESNNDLIKTNQTLTEKIFVYKDTISSLQRKAELEQIKYTMGKSESEFKLDLYKLEMQSKLELFKSEMQTKTELFNSQLEFERRQSTHRARQSALISGLIVGGTAILGAMVISWTPATWFK
jgi:hypothetical protein